VIKKVPLGVSFDEIRKLDLVIYSAISFSSVFGGFFIVDNFHFWSYSSSLACLFLFFGFCYIYNLLWLIH